VDAGFDVAVFADMLDSLSRFADAEIPVEDPSALRVFASDWADALRRGRQICRSVRPGGHR
jgi:hypothetical protein